MRYRTKPEYVDALRIIAVLSALGAVPLWLAEAAQAEPGSAGSVVYRDGQDGNEGVAPHYDVYITEAEKPQACALGDWIVRTSEGVLLVMTDEMFTMGFEPVEEVTDAPAPRDRALDDAVRASIEANPGLFGGGAGAIGAGLAADAGEQRFAGEQKYADAGLQAVGGAPVARPSVGRIVHYHATNPGLLGDSALGPVPAIITRVRPSSVDLTVFRVGAEPCPVRDVPFNGDAKADDQHIWFWPPRS